MKENNGRYDKALSDEYYRLCGLISKTKATSFIQSVLERWGKMGLVDTKVEVQY
jgi:hypothetical protein